MRVLASSVSFCFTLINTVTVSWGLNQSQMTCAQVHKRIRWRHRCYGSSSHHLSVGYFSTLSDPADSVLLVAHVDTLEKVCFSVHAVELQ